MTARIDFMGCPLDAYTFQEAVDEIARRIREKAGTTLVHFLNVAKIVKARSSPEIREILWDGDLVLADGKPLLFFGRRLGLLVPERIPGIDLMQALLDLSNRAGFRVYLLGAKPEVLESCRKKLAQRFPSLDVAGLRNGYFKPEETGAIVEEINRARPDILFLGMGTPQKERFAFENRGKLKVPIVQGVGGTFDVIAGIARRAPRWMQELGLEWLFRVLQEPRRLLWRYFSTNVLFLALFLRAWLRLRVGGKTGLASKEGGPRSPG